jgi:dTDP-4-amino-4,6-dideoxygalactose transaminase
VIRSEMRDALKEYLASLRIPTVINYPKALPFYPAYKYLGHSAQDFPVAYAHQSRILSIPIYPEMSVDDQERVASAIAHFASEHIPADVSATI